MLIVVIASFAFFAALLGWLGYVITREIKKQNAWFAANRQLVRHGRLAPGLVRTIGPSRRGKLIFTVTVEVQPSDEDPFVAHAEIFVPLHAAASLSPNKPIVVRYDPATRAVAVDFEAMGYAPAP